VLLLMMMMLVTSSDPAGADAAPALDTVVYLQEVELPKDPHAPSPAAEEPSETAEPTETAEGDAAEVKVTEVRGRTSHHHSNARLTTLPSSPS
jgi:hypothetical protein